MGYLTVQSNHESPDIQTDDDTGGMRHHRALTSARRDAVPVLRPSLATSDRLLPYLRRIDAARIYTNWGPLTRELEKRLQAHFGISAAAVVSASSGTAALIGGILATAGRATRRRPLAIIPAFTFVATAVAVEQCGFEPHVVDVDRETWQIDPERALSRSLVSRTGVVVPVAPFGRPVSQAAWRRFRDRTAIPVVIDAAAGFETLTSAPESLVGEIPVAVSFHATKSFATGEGGCVITTSRRVARLVAQALNFGFYGSRDSRTASTNGKMSEYHAAVGLAELDGWLQKQQRLRRVADHYRRRFERIGRDADFFAAPDVAGCYALFRCADRREANRVRRQLAAANIDYRLWYGEGLLAQPHFAAARHDAVGVTEDLSRRIVGLPMAVDLGERSVTRVVAAVAEATNRRTRRRKAVKPAGS